MNQENTNNIYKHLQHLMGMAENSNKIKINKHKVGMARNKSRIKTKSNPQLSPNQETLKLYIRKENNHNPDIKLEKRAYRLKIGGEEEELAARKHE